MEDIKLAIGTRIKELRNIEKMSQEDLANLADLDRTYVSSVERGKRNISIVNIKKICSAFKIDLCSFFDSEVFK